MDGTVLKRAEFPPAEALGVSEATGFAANGSRVVLHLANGRTPEGDLLVGAAKST